MAWYFDENNAGSANGGGDVMFDLKALILARGGTIHRSGGGTGSGLYSASADVCTTKAIMATSRAWWIILYAGRYFYAQRGSYGNSYWWLRVGYTAPTTGGDEDDMPTAADTQDWDGSTNAGALIFGTANTYRYHIGVDDAGGGFYAFALTNATGAAAGGIVFDPLAAASVPAEDTDPAIYYAAGNFYFGDPAYLSGISDTYSPRSWHCRGLGAEVAAPGALVLTAGGYPYGNSTSFVRNLGTNPHVTVDDRIDISYARPGAVSQPGWKGRGTVMRWAGVARSNGTTMRTGATIDRVQVNGIILPYANAECAL